MKKSNLYYVKVKKEFSAETNWFILAAASFYDALRTGQRIIELDFPGSGYVIHSVEHQGECFIDAS